MDEFNLGKYDFGIETVTYNIKPNGRFFDIYGDREAFEKIKLLESRLQSAVNPPKICVWGLPFSLKNVEIPLDDNNIHNIDCALYFDKYHKIYGEMIYAKVDGQRRLIIDGIVNVMGDDLRLTLDIEINGD